MTNPIALRYKKVYIDNLGKTFFHSSFITMERLQRLFGAAAAGHQPGIDTPTVDNAEMVYISSLALLKVNNQKETI
jgi:hypothetical protein